MSSAPMTSREEIRGFLTNAQVLDPENKEYYEALMPYSSKLSKIPNLSETISVPSRLNFIKEFDNLRSVLDDADILDITREVEFRRPITDSPRDEDNLDSTPITPDSDSILIDEFLKSRTPVEMYDESLVDSLDSGMNNSLTPYRNFDLQGIFFKDLKFYCTLSLAEVSLSCAKKYTRPEFLSYLIEKHGVGCWDANLIYIAGLKGYNTFANDQIIMRENNLIGFDNNWEKLFIITIIIGLSQGNFDSNEYPSVVKNVLAKKFFGIPSISTNQLRRYITANEGIQLDETFIFYARNIRFIESRIMNILAGHNFQAYYIESDQKKSQLYESLSILCKVKCLLLTPFFNSNDIFKGQLTGGRNVKLSAIVVQNSTVPLSQASDIKGPASIASKERVFQQLGKITTKEEDVVRKVGEGLGRYFQSRPSSLLLVSNLVEAFHSTKSSNAILEAIHEEIKLVLDNYV